MVERTVTMAETGSRSDCALHIEAGALDRRFDGQALRKTGGDCRGESAAGAMGVPAVDARAVPDPQTGSGREHVVHCITRQVPALEQHRAAAQSQQRDRKSTRLNSSHRCISYAVFCLKKKKKRSKQ